MINLRNKDLTKKKLEKIEKKKKDKMKEDFIHSQSKEAFEKKKLICFPKKKNLRRKNILRRKKSLPIF